MADNRCPHCGDLVFNVGVCMGEDAKGYWWYTCQLCEVVWTLPYFLQCDIDNWEWEQSG